MARDLLIRDKDYEKALGELGFCTLPLFSTEQIGAIRSLYDQFAMDRGVSGLIASHSTPGEGESLRISHAIRDIVFPSLQDKFQNFDFFIAGFMVKEGNTDAEFPLHQDWNILDESEYTSYQIWVPLDLSYPANGGMFVLPGSHLFFPNYRSGTYGLPVVQTDESLKPLIVDMVIPVGEVLVYHNSLFHASYPNQSGLNRAAAIVSIYQKNAPLRYFQKNAAQNRTDTYAIDSAVFLASLSRLEKGGLPEPQIDVQALPLNTIDNASITSTDLVQKFKTRFWDSERSFEPTMLHLLKDETLEKKIQRDGFAILDFLDADTVAFLKEEYIRLFSSSHTSIGRFTPMEHTSPQTKRYIHDLIIEKAHSALEKYFKNYQTPIASFFIKYARSHGDLTWHNDSSLLLNTHLEPHYGIWCPLVDVNEENGVFCLIERSHKFSHVTFLNGMQWPYSPYMPAFDQKKKTFHLKAGQMILFDLRLIHDALPNKTDEDRICFCVRLTHHKSQYYSFIREEENSEIVSVFRERPDYYLRDDWTDGNQMRNPENKIGEMSKIYDRIDHHAIVADLAALQPALGYSK